MILTKRFTAGSGDRLRSAGGQPGPASWAPQASGQPLPIALACVLLVSLWAGRLRAEEPSASGSAGLTESRIARVDALIEQGWKDFEVRPASACDDGQWCRRVYLDLLGRIPTWEELSAFEQSRDRDKRADLVRRLLYGGEYQEQLVRHWSGVWANVLVGRGAAAGDDRMTSSSGLKEYLAGAIRENKPYDQLVYELITAEGTNLPGSESFNGAVNFLAGKLEDRATQATSDTARIFLGMQIQCTQCHNHPFNDWKQDQFWGLNSFFRQAVALRKPSVDASPARRALELTDQDFAGENQRRSTPERAEVYYELRNGDLRASYPMFIDGQTISTSGYLEDSHRRRQLGELMIHSPSLAEALVNRLWGYFLGYGFTRPVDDMGPHNPVSHPELLEFLAEQTRLAGYDLRQLMTWIVLSRPYGLSSNEAARGPHDDPALGQTPRFSRFYVRQMQPEQLYDSLMIATHGTGEGVLEMDPQTKEGWLRQFAIDLGTDEGDETTTFDGTIPQTLMMFNGNLMQQATKSDGDTLLARLWQNPQLTLRDKVSRLYQVALARSPDRSELVDFRELLAASGDAQTALEDLWWALLNSSEFILIH